MRPIKLLGAVPFIPVLGYVANEYHFDVTPGSCAGSAGSPRVLRSLNSRRRVGRTSALHRCIINADQGACNENASSL